MIVFSPEISYCHLHQADNNHTPYSLQFKTWQFTNTVRYLHYILPLLVCFICASSLQAETLSPPKQISSSPHIPKHFLGVDKNRQKLYLFGHRSPTRILRSLPCTTGQIPGDKFYEGDKRTPEGIYFLEREITYTVDYELYGNLAYTMNYPNPVDRLQGKTGHSIWLHGRGKPLVPKDTKGCVALETDKLEELSQYIDLTGTPIIVGQEINYNALEPELEATSLELYSLVQDWAQAWSNQKNSFFQFYHAQKFSRSTEPFADFKAQKKELFARYDWIDVFLDQIKVVPGNDYWVTYFKQFYRSSGFQSEGIKRFYWKKVDDQWQIVGREWRPQPLQMERSYLNYKEKEIKNWLQDWLAAWENADLEEYSSFYATNARQNQTQGLQHITAEKKYIWDNEPPAAIEIQDLQTRLHPQGFKVSFDQKYEGTAGYSDYGRKNMVLQIKDDSFRILSEDWQSY